MKSQGPEPVPPVTFSVRLTPRASANAACCQFVAKLLDVPSSQVSVKSGHKSRNKVLLIVGTTQEDVHEALAPYGNQ